MKSARLLLVIAACVVVSTSLGAGSAPLRASKGIVSSSSNVASQIGADVLKEGGTAMDAIVATAFALAVTLPSAGNIGGGGFLVYRTAAGDSVAYDFREKAPAKASATMFLVNGKYSSEIHHNGYLSVGVPGTVAGLHMAWKEQGKLPWKRLVEPAVGLARGLQLSINLANGLRTAVTTSMKPYPASVAEFSKNGVPYEAGETLRQPDLARTLERIANEGPPAFYEGEVAAAIEKDMLAHGGLITREDLKNYKAVRRTPVKGTYRGYDVISMPPPTSGGVVLVEMLNILEGYDLAKMGPGSAGTLHLMTEAMRRGYADRARYLADSDFVNDMPIPRLTSKEYAAQLRKTIDPNRASKSSPTSFEWTSESDETTHVSVVDASRNAATLTYTLEGGYGAKIVVPGMGFLLNNEMGDFNAGPGITTVDGLIGTEPNLAAPGKRMLSSMCPTILAKDGKLAMVTGSPGGRTIINTVLETILNVVDFGMNAQEATDAGRIHHQWLPDRIQYEKFGFSPDTLADLQRRGHTLQEGRSQGSAQVIVYNAADDMLEGANDRRSADGAAVGVQAWEMKSPQAQTASAKR
jgi:gamma-glutamyltranspeptidase / glutathione hydrolase